MAKRKERVTTFGRDTETREPARHHWFTSSYLHWRVGDDLEGTLKRQREADTRQGGYTARQCNVWRVPGPNKGTNYKIEDYAPKVEGAEFVGTIWYDSDNME